MGSIEIINNIGILKLKWILNPNLEFWKRIVIQIIYSIGNA